MYSPKNGLRVYAALKRLQDPYFSIFNFLRPYFTPKSKMSSNFKLQILKISKEFSYEAWNFGKIKFTWLHSV